MNRKSIEIEDIRKEVYCRDGYQCQHGGCKTFGYENLQMAHRISLSEKNIKHVIRFWYEQYKDLKTRKEAEKILNNKLNLVASCADHNQSFLIDSSDLKIDELLRRIKRDMDGEDILDECLMSGRLPV